MLINRTIQIPVFLRIGHGLIGDLPGLLGEHNLHFQNALVVASPRGKSLVGKPIMQALGVSDCLVVGDNTMATVVAVRAEARARRPDLIVGVGGGTALDVAKLVAAHERVCFLSVPTTPSHDGIASPVAVIRTSDRPESLPARMPIGVIADLDVLEQAPAESVRAGLGDLISNVSAIADWELACRRKRDRMDDFARLLALAGADAVLQYASAGGRPDPKDRDLIEILLNGLVLSGVAMEIAGSSRPCSGAEHLFSHALDRIAERPAMHGAQVGLGTLLMSVLRDQDWPRLRDSMVRLGVPTRAEDVGVERQEVIDSFVQAPRTRPERYTILNEVTVTPEHAELVARTAGVI